MDLRSHIKRLSCRSALSARNVDVIRPPPRSLVGTRDKCIVTEKQLTILMCPDRLSFHTLMHKPLVTGHGSRMLRAVTS